MAHQGLLPGLPLPTRMVSEPLITTGQGEVSQAVHANQASAHAECLCAPQ